MTRESAKAEAARLRVLEGTVDMLTQVNQLNTLADSLNTYEQRRWLRKLSEDMMDQRMDPFNDAIMQQMRDTKTKIEQRHAQLLGTLDQIIQRAEEMNQRMKQPAP